jgi:triosephosphate isomerase
MKYIVANWKSNKTMQECRQWINTFLSSVDTSAVKTALEQDRVQIVIAPPYPFIVPIREMIKGRRNIVLAAQNVSHFPAGSYTGEIAARSLTDLVVYAIIGHSERRVHLHETAQQISDKITYARENDISPILCVREIHEYSEQNVEFVAFEKFEAIGAGKNVPLDAVLSVRKNLNLKVGVKFLYGASVDRHNAAMYLRCPEIDGVLVGTASQNPQDFLSVVLEI